MPPVTALSGKVSKADWREDSKCWQVALHVAKLAKLTGSPALEVVVLMYFMSVRLVGDNVYEFVIMRTLTSHETTCNKADAARILAGLWQNAYRHSPQLLNLPIFGLNHFNGASTSSTQDKAVDSTSSDGALGSSAAAQKLVGAKGHGYLASNNGTGAADADDAQVVPVYQGDQCHEDNAQQDEQQQQQQQPRRQFVIPGSPGTPGTPSTPSSSTPGDWAPSLTAAVDDRHWVHVAGRPGMQCLEAGLVLGNVDEAAQVLTQGGDAAEVVAVAAEAPPQAAAGMVQQHQQHQDNEDCWWHQDQYRHQNSDDDTVFDTEVEVQHATSSTMLFSWIQSGVSPCPPPAGPHPTRPFTERELATWTWATMLQSTASAFSRYYAWHGKLLAGLLPAVEAVGKAAKVAAAVAAEARAKAEAKAKAEAEARAKAEAEAKAEAKAEA